MTELLYQTDSYAREFDAVVAATTEGGVVLDRTAFYPGGGGQPCDLGLLEAGDAFWPASRIARVCGQVVHFLDGEPPPTGTAVKGILVGSAATR